MKWVRIILINLLVACGLLVAIEMGSGLLPSKEKSGSSIREHKSQEYIQEEELLGFGAIPGVTAQSKKTKGEEIIYDVVYEFDLLGRRVVPGSKTMADAFVAFVGDSNTFGEGLQGEQSLPAQFSQRFPHYKVYNYAFRGYGLGNVLALLESDRLREEMPQGKGLVVYPFMSHHAHRLIGTIHFFSWSPGWHPLYHWKDGESLVRNGTFKSTAPLRVKMFKFLSGLKFFKWLDRDYPDPYSSENFKMVCQALKQMKEGVERGSANHQFVLMVGGRIKNQRSKIIGCLKKHEISFVDVSEARKGVGREQWRLHKYDPHHSALANEKRAQLLGEKLVLKGIIEAP